MLWTKCQSNCSDKTARPMWDAHCAKITDEISCYDVPRVIEDYVVLYFGSSVFKIARLLSVAMMSVHFFACVYYRVKEESAASPEDVELFYTSRGVDPNVSCILHSVCSEGPNLTIIFKLQNLSKSYVSCPLFTSLSK